MEPVPDSGKAPLHSARFAPARLPEPATSPRPALCAHSCAKLAAIGACRQDVVQISLTIFGLWGMIPTRLLTKSIVVASLTKVSLELLLLPVTLKASLWLKKIENVDYFDKETNFNPLR